MFLQVILSLIKTRVKKDICDEVLKVAWSMLWNVTGNLYFCASRCMSVLLQPALIL